MAYPTTSDNLSDAHASGQLITSADVNAIETDVDQLTLKVGKGASLPTTTGTVLTVTSAGSSTWQIPSAITAAPHITLSYPSPAAGMYEGAKISGPVLITAVSVRVLPFGSSVTLNLINAGRSLFTTDQAVPGGTGTAGWVALTPNLTYLPDGSSLDINVVSVSGSPVRFEVDVLMALTTAQTLYAWEVMKDNPVAYWRLGGTAAPRAAIDNSINGHPITFTGAGVTYNVTNASITDGDKAVTFNGSTGGGTAPNLDLSAAIVITAEFWLNWTTYAGDDKLAFDFTSGGGGNVGGWDLDPNSSAWAGTFEIDLNGTVGLSTWTIARPSAGAFHHYAFVLTYGSPDTCVAYVDGSAVTVTTRTAASNTTSQHFANSTLYFMNRSLTSLFGAGSLDEVAIYPSALSSGRIAAHYAAR